MINNKNIKIVSSGCYLPKCISSSEIEINNNIPKGWSEKYNGVKNRHHVTFETNGYMGARAIESALEKSDLHLSDIDLIISAGASFDYILPNQSSTIKSELKYGVSYNIPGIDIDATCLSFMTSFDIASKMMDGYQYKNIIIVASEVASKGLNGNNFETATLFGDGAAAIILSFDSDNKSSYIKGSTKTYSEGVFDTIIKGGGVKYYFKDHSYDPELHSFQMNGRKLLKLAKREMNNFTVDFFNDIDYSMDDVDIVVPHQASKIGLELFKKMYSIDAGKIMSNIESHGNCIAASIPLIIHQSIHQNKLKRGDLCLLIGTSAGFSIGASLFRY